MGQVRFEVSRGLSLPARVVFDELVDWQGHAAWVPLTRVVLESGDGGVGTTFVATTGIGPIALPDRMRVESIDRGSMTATVVKIGPLLTGEVYLAVQPSGDTASRLTWREDVRVPGLPGILSRPVAAIAAKAFSVAIGRMEKQARAKGRRPTMAA